MIPLKDNIPSRSFPFVTVSLIFINIIVFLFQLTLGRYLGVFIATYGVTPAVFLSDGAVLWKFLTLFTSIFLHGGLVHLLGNMLTLWIFGDNVEDRMGHGKYLLFYLTCGVTASLTHVFMNPASTLPSIGASGAIAGVMGAYLLLYPRARVITLIPVFFLYIVEVHASFFMLFWFLLQFFSGIMSIGAPAYQSGGVAWWAHIGGFITGVILIIPFRRKTKRRIIHL